MNVKVAAHDQIPVAGVPPVIEALSELRHGGMVLVVDEQGDEPGAVLVLSAEKATPRSVAFMVRHTSGLICVAMTDERADSLGLPLMVPRAAGAGSAAFTVSVDAKNGVTTGISAADRAVTIQALSAETTRHDDLARPGHVFALRARAGGVLEHAGDAESAVDLCRLAGMADVGVLAKVVDSQGGVAHPAQLQEFASTHGLRFLTSADIIRHRQRTERLVHAVAQGELSTPYGEFGTVTFRGVLDGAKHIALVRGNVCPSSDGLTAVTPLVAVHSQCIVGDVFGSRVCDCHRRLHAAMSVVATAGSGVVVYLGEPTQNDGEVVAPCCLQVGRYEHDVVAQILRDLGARQIQMVAYSSVKPKLLEDNGISVIPPGPAVNSAARMLSHRRASDRMACASAVVLDVG